MAPVMLKAFVVAIRTKHCFQGLSQINKTVPKAHFQAIVPVLFARWFV